MTATRIDTSDDGRRPFYSEYAWAFDLLIDRPVKKEGAAIVTWLTERGVFPGARLLDAGCGTGRYAIELARRGYLVRGIDSSDELIAVARDAVGDPTMPVSFTIGDISALAPACDDVVLCRGVLNDFLEDESRLAVFAGFQQVLRPGGVLILDVREWEATAERKRREPLFRKSVSTNRGTLTFTSLTEVDPETRRLTITERHTLNRDGDERSSDYVFVMRCWTREEMESILRLTGFKSDSYFGAYDADVAAGNTDRLVVVAQV